MAAVQALAVCRLVPGLQVPKKGGTMPARSLISPGTIFERLTVLGNFCAQVSGRPRTVCRVRCVCGKEFNAPAYHLRSGNTKSCGCLQRETVARLSTKHGYGKRTPTYRTWANMLTRCRNTRTLAFSRYGKKGITVCESWKSFEAFLKDMGERPRGRTLDRVDNSKGYYKENCRWATQKQQANNKTNNRVLEHNGERKTLAEWAESAGLKYATLLGRLDRGWGMERAIATPRQDIGRWRK